MTETITSLPHVPQADYARIRDGLARVEAAVARGEYVRSAMEAALDAGAITPDLEDYVRENMETAEQKIADEIARLALEFTNVLLDVHQDRLAAGFAKTHPSLLANLLRATLKACRIRKGDERLPSWSWENDLPVPHV